MNTPKRHHLVPQFYLRRFAVNGQVELLERDELSKVIPCAVGNALVAKHYYNMETNPHPPDPYLESTLFAEAVEPDAARSIRRVVDEGVPLSMQGLRDRMSLFVAFQFLRGQATRHPMVESYKATARVMLKLMTPDMARKTIREVEGVEASDEDIRELLKFAANSDRHEMRVTHENNLHIRQMVDAVWMADAIASRHWRLLEFEHDALVTGDDPVGLVGKTRVPGEPIGLLTAREIVFPVDPRHAFVLTKELNEGPYSRASGTPMMANIINRHVAFRCHRHIVRMPGTDPLRGICLPKKAPATSIQGNMVITRFGISKREAKKERWRPLRPVIPPRRG